MFTQINPFASLTAFWRGLVRIMIDGQIVLTKMVHLSACPSVRGNVLYIKILNIAFLNRY
jgi:hypothetical protein